MTMAAGMVVESVIAIQNYIAIEYLFLTKHNPQGQRKLWKKERSPNGEVMNKILTVFMDVWTK